MIQKWIKREIFMIKHISQTGVHKEMQRHKTTYKKKDRLKINNPDFYTRILKIRNNKCWRGCGKKETTAHHWWKYRLVQPVFKWYGGSSGNYKCNYHMIQWFHFCIFTWWKQKHSFEKIRASLYSLQHYLQ